MSSKYLSGSYPSGYTLSGVYTSVTLGSSGSIGGTGLVGWTAAHYAILNPGRIEASVSLASGIELRAGGTITNGSSGKTSASIGGAGGTGIVLDGGTIANHVAISGGSRGYYGGSGGTAILLAALGSIENAGTILAGSGGRGGVVP